MGANPARGSDAAETDARDAARDPHPRLLGRDTPEYEAWLAQMAAVRDHRPRSPEYDAWLRTLPQVNAEHNTPEYNAWLRALGAAP